MIHKHRCYGCDMEIWEEPFEADGKMWVKDFCDECVKKDKNRERAVKEIFVYGVNSIGGVK